MVTASMTMDQGSSTSPRGARPSSVVRPLKLLIVDDHPEIRFSLRRLLKRVPGLEFAEADSVESAMAEVVEGVDLLLLDIRLSDDPRDRGGLEILRRVEKLGRKVPAVIVSASDAMDDLREAMRLGARDYVLKDELCEELIAPIVDGFRERLSLTGEVQRLRARVDSDWGLDAIVGSSGTMQRVRSTVTKIADADAPVLILGETGTGKEMVARAIHHVSPRREKPFVAVNCSALPSDLLESLLFGHERGAFTGEGRPRSGRMAAAEDGTLLLDEVGDLPLDVQGKLLRVLEEKRFLPVGADQEVPLHARILAATNADLHKRVQSGQFRSDLFFRLDVVTIRLPRLSERGGDLVELLVSFAEGLPRPLKFTDRAIEWLAKRPLARERPRATQHGAAALPHVADREDRSAHARRARAGDHGDARVATAARRVGRFGARHARQRRLQVPTDRARAAATRARHREWQQVGRRSPARRAAEGAAASLGEADGGRSGRSRRLRRLSAIGRSAIAGE
jgi:two-component system response regulator HydG